MGGIQDYHLRSPLLKILTHLHDRLHERYVVPCSMLMLEEISKQVLFCLNLPCPPKSNARLISFAFPESHPFIGSLSIFNGMIILKKVISYPICPCLVQEHAFLRGAVLAVRS